MKREELVETLRRIHFLDEVSDELIQRLADLTESTTFEAGDVVFRQGDTPSHLHLVVAGQVALEMCGSSVGCKRILTLGPGELLGWSPVLARERMTVTARAIEPTRTFRIDARGWSQFAETNPRLGYEFMRCAALALGRRLNATRLQLLDVYGGQLPSADEPSAPPGPHPPTNPTAS